MTRLRSRSKSSHASADADPYYDVVASHGEAKAYIGELGERTRSLAEAAHQVLVAQGCESYVKTIYIGYDIGGEMVAAMYGHPDCLEIALALSEDAEGGLLVDASHLTWQTLPVAAVVRHSEDLLQFESLTRAASNRIRSRSHDVRRDNDFFAQRKAERRSRR